MTDAPAPDLQLLLCDAADRSPSLEGGLDPAALADAEAPTRGPHGKDSYELEALHRDPNDLAAQRWAVIAPEGSGGDAALAAIEALVDHRRAQQGAVPMVFRVPDGMDAAASLRWKHEVLRDEAAPVDERPRYLLILGDLDRVSLELQHTLANGSFVGRLHCPTPSGYRAYAEKVVAHERREPAPRPRSLFYTVEDGSAAVASGYRHLVAPCVRMQVDLAARGKLRLDGPSEVPYSDWGPDELMMMASADVPSLLCSVSHGLGAPRRGWRSPDHQRALQGALSIGPDEPLCADMLREAPFLPGGVWQCVACYSGGTPPASAYYGWISLLAGAGGTRAAEAKAVLRSLPSPGEAPFVAALPQALLANPRGPVGIIAHMDLAWTFGFTDPSSKRSRASRMLAAQRAILGGSRVGVGLDALMHAYRETNDELMARYQLQRDAAARGEPDPVSPRQLGELWMQRNDLRGYVLLGDPAARLAVASGQPPAIVERSDIDERPEQSTRIDLDRRPDGGESSVAESSRSSPDGNTTTDLVETSQLPEQPVPVCSDGPAQDLLGSETTRAAPDAAIPPNPPPALDATPASKAKPRPPRVESPPDEVIMSTPPPNQPNTGSAAEPTPARRAAPDQPPQAPTSPPAAAPSYSYPPSTPIPPPPLGAAPLSSVGYPRTIEHPQIALRERAVLAMIRGDEAPRSIAARFGLPLEEVFYWLDVYREAGRRALGG